jgi:hypothetical protein
MKWLVVLGMAGIVLGFGGVSFAGDNDMAELYAMTQLADQTSGSVQAMSDQQLKSVEGMSYVGRYDCGCGYNYQSVYINQANWMDQVNYNSGGRRNGYVDQMNNAYQTNFAMVR